MNEDLRRTFRFYKHEIRKLLTRLYYRLLRRPDIPISDHCPYILNEKKETYLKAFKV